MKQVLTFAALVLLGGCESNGAPATSERQQPSSTTPGVVISGHAKVGVIKEF